MLPRGEEKVLKAEDKDYERGLLVKLLANGVVVSSSRSSSRSSSSSCSSGSSS